MPLEGELYKICKESLVQRYGLVVSKRRIGKIMNFLNLKTKMRRKFKVSTTNLNHNFTIAPNRIKRDFYSSIPNDKYVGDITYIQTKQGTMYLAIEIFYNRKRLHSYNNYMSPVDFEEKMLLKEIVA